ncbi:hypothetical protein A2U01_0041983, partial [Trifolium medium]|nr:hypothetical protein [Trifolium medium]
MATEEVIGDSAVGATEKPFKFEGLHFKRTKEPAVTVTNNAEKSVSAEKDKDQIDPAEQIK